MLSRALLAVCCIAACERAGLRDHERPPTPVPARDATVVERDAKYRVIYAARTDDLADHSPNGTYFSIIEDEALFLVADAAEPAVSKRAADLIGDLVAGACKASVDDEAKLRCALEGVHAELTAKRQTTAIVVVVALGNQVLVTRAGNPPLVWRRGDTLDVIESMESALGSPAWRFHARWLEIGRGDTLLLMNRRLRMAAGDTELRAATDAKDMTKQALEATVIALATHAASARAPTDPMSVIALHFAALRRD